MERAMAQDAAKNLELLALFVEIDVKTIVQSAVVMRNADLRFDQFERKEELFATNPANTVAYQGMHALEGQAIVRIAEALGKDAKLVAEGTDLRRKADLVCHRDAISHAFTVGDAWRKKANQEFDAGGRQWHDRKAALVWDMWRSLNEELAKLGKPQRDLTVGIGWQHAAVLHLIMRCSVKAGVALPTEQDMFDHLQKFRDRYVELLEQAPNGRNLEAEARSRARRDELRQRWSKSV